MAGWMLQLRMRSFGAFPHLVMTGYSIPKKQLTSLAIEDCSRQEAGEATVKTVLNLMLCCPCAALLLQLDVVVQRRRGDTIQV
jgi:hypothetical protein